jgi:hypothetical protein
MTDYYDNALGTTSDGEAPAGFFDSGDGVEFSKRNAPDLANQRLMVKQENPRKWRTKINQMRKDQQISGELADIMDIILVGQEGQDAVLSSLDQKTKARIKSVTNKQVLLKQMKCYAWDAYNPEFTTMEMMRQVHMDELLSRAEKGDRNNERLLQAEAQTTSVMKQELTQHQAVPEKKGLIKRIFGR